MTAPELIQEACRRGLRMEPRGDKLAVIPAGRVPPEFAELLRQHKAALLQLLHLNFLIVHSNALNATVFWTPDEFTKDRLIAAGADPGSVYTRAELAELVNGKTTSEDLPTKH